MKTDGYICVEVQVPGIAATGQTQLIYNFLDQPYLRPPTSVVVAVQSFSLNTQALSPVSGKANVTLAIMAKSSLTLYGRKKGTQNSSEIIQKIPLYNLNTIQNASTDPFSRELFEVEDLEIDFQKSYVTIASAPANTTDMAFIFGFYYNLLK